MSHCFNCEGMATVTMPVAEFEAIEDRHEREKTNLLRSLIATILILAVALIGTNAFWLYRESQFEDVESVIEEVYELDAADGGNAIINGDGSVNVNG